MSLHISEDLATKKGYPKRKCLFCQKSFFIKTRENKKRFCSASCRHKGWIEKLLNSYRENAEKQKS